jgi:hypothetical protein
MKDKVMNIQNRLLFVTATVIAAMFITPARAQYRTTGDDGISASPKLRAMLNERAMSTAISPAAPTTLASAGYRGRVSDAVAASPKLREMLNEQEASWAVAQPSTAFASVGYRGTGDDGITASPKLREELNGQTPFMIAPIK